MGIGPDKHLLTRYLAKLTKNGALAVILQSGAPCQSILNKNSGTLINNEQIENIVYPMRANIENKPVMQNKDSQNFTNAEVFLECYNRYKSAFNGPL